MDELRRISEQLVETVDLAFQRYLMAELPWDYRLLGIKGARGTGKTTLLLQRMKLTASTTKSLYLSLDDLYFTTHSLLETVRQAVVLGYEVIYLDEVHKYEGWAREVKNAYDQYPALKMVFTGSSILDLESLEVDLSRRALLQELFGLSFREFLQLTTGQQLPSLRLTDLLQDHVEIAQAIIKSIRPLAYFEEYLQVGYFPFFLEGKEVYHPRLQQVIRATVEVDAANSPLFSVRNPRKVLQLLQILSESVPFTPNISKLASKTGMDRNTIYEYLFLLQKARLVRYLLAPNQSISRLQKPEKLYLDNPNLMFALATTRPNPGNLRETFFFSQVSSRFEVAAPRKGDFLVESTFTFEVGGRNKSHQQLAGEADAYLVVDDWDVGLDRKIPLWMFGLLY